MRLDPVSSNMPPLEPPSIAPLSVAQRRELQRRFERAWQIMQQSSTRSLDAHRELLECVATDPASALYLDALLLNLRKPDHGNRKSFWLGRWARQSRVVAAALRDDWSTVLASVPELLLEDPRNLPLLTALTDAHHARGHRESAWRCVEETLLLAERDPEVRRRAARVRMSRGQFARAREDWLFVSQAAPGDPEAAHYLPLLPAESNEAPEAAEDRRPANGALPDDDFTEWRRQLRADLEAHRWRAAESRLAAARARFGSRLELREFNDDLALAQHAAQLEIARRLVDAEPRRQAAAPTQIEVAGRLWRTLADELQESQLRLEVEILAGRCRLYPHDLDLHARLATRLELQGNWAEAARCWELACATPEDVQAAVAWHRLGEIRQRQRQFGPALACYRTSLGRSGRAAGGTEIRRATLAQASRLARALGREGEAQDYDRELAELVARPSENHGSSAEGP